MNKRTVKTSKEILHNLPYEAISVTLDANVFGKGLASAGTVLAGDGASVFKDRTKKVKPVRNAEVSGADHIDGILLTDVDLSKGDATGALVYRGTVNSDKLVDQELAKDTSTLATKLPHIVFVKGGTK
ncbi:TPA: head decoration protein [Streptococcus agalactiae]|nr:head decoration protein [Streptococcus agalactiae]HEN9150347.1 head decoration protein [Streptococcus agalactiae]